MERHLRIDTDRCIGCGLCVSHCIRGNIRIIENKAVEHNEGPFGCFDCGHCSAICPSDAIRLVVPGDVHDYNPDEKLIRPETLSEFFARRRSCRWFKDEPVSKEEFGRIASVADTSPTAENSQDVSIVVLDEKVSEFMVHIRDILGKIKDNYPRIRQFCDYVDDGMKGNNPLI
ncbi:MAG: nitroreductase family protein, partial [archaeon]|nr:nitroreductase family protein [archaeon]